MDNIKITNEYIDETLDIINGIYVRKENLPEIRNKFELLWKTIKLKTGKSVKSDLLRFKGVVLIGKSCICSCNKCESLFVIEDEDTNIKLAVGSSCINKFKNETLNSDIYYHIHGKKCIVCNDILIKRNNNSNKPVNSDMKSDICWKCYLTPVFLNVPYSDKDYVKMRGAKWNPEERKWYIHRDNKNYYHLTNKYPLL